MKLINAIIFHTIATLTIVTITNNAMAATISSATATTTTEILHTMRRLVKKPTNSVTIRQVNMSNICQNRTTENFVKNDRDCTKFFVCIDNETILEGVCPNNMYYNDKIQLCDVAANTICESKPIEDEDENSKIDMNLEIANATAYCITKAEIPNQITFVGSSKKCNQYYICYHERALLQECSENLHWNSFIGKCDKPENAECTLRNNNINNNNNDDATVIGASKSTAKPSLLQSSLSSISSNLINCPNDGEHVFPHMQRCDLFIYCYRGNIMLQQCPFYHHFDILTKTCQWRNKSLCMRNLALSIS